MRHLSFREGVCAVVGGGFGSEGKGLVVSRIYHQYQHHVRVGAANAGHTGYFPSKSGGRFKIVSQQLPMAAWVANDYDLFVYVGPGAVISKEILLREIEESQINRRRLMIDPRAHVITQDQIDREQETDLAARIGSTSTVAKEGIGTATADRVMRSADCSYVSDLDNRDLHPYMGDVPLCLSGVESILLEGTQGTGLSLTTGFHPYTTSRNTTAAGLLADSGVAPARLNRCIGVFRTFPIRVAGNSGPFYSDSEEIQFEDLNVQPEVTTVTKLRRRIATWSKDQYRESHRLNGFTEVWLTFMDYIESSLYGCNGNINDWEHGKAWSFIQDVQKSLPAVPIVGIGTGPDSTLYIP